MPLSHAQIENADPRPKSYKIYDALGLYLEVGPTGTKWWRARYYFDGKEKRLSLGVFPKVSLKQARERRDAIRRHVKRGVDPSVARGALRANAEDAANLTFEAIAREWLAKYARVWAASHGDKIVRRLEMYVFPWIGKRAIRELKPIELLGCVQRIENRGTSETAHRTLQACGRVLRYAVATDRVDRDFTRDLRGALAPVKGKHLASIKDPNEIGALLRAISGYNGNLITKFALRFAPLVFVRPGELRQATWSEFDLDIGEWRIPPARMKMRAPHVVPLSKQAVKIITELKPLTGHRPFVFPGVRDWRRPMSNNTMNAALRRLGYDREDMTPHGFRSMASTLLNEQGWNRDAIERQLAHREQNSVRAAYNYADYLGERRKMMQAWADYLDQLSSGPKEVAA